MSFSDTGMAAVAAITNQLKVNAAKMATSSYTDMRSSSLSQYSAELQLRPTFALETELIHDPEMGKLIQTANSNYASFYIIALSIDNTISGVRMGRAVGKYNPARDATGEAIQILGDTAIRVSTASYNPMVSNESASHSFFKSTQPAIDLLSYDSTMKTEFPDLPAAYLDTKPKYLSRESIFYRPNPDNDFEDEMNNNLKDNTSTTKLSEGTAGKFQEDLHAMKNLAVGRILTVDVQRDQCKATVNVLLKPELKSLRSKTLVEISGITKKAHSMSERWNAFWNREQIHSAWDYLTCRDLAEAHRRNLVEDTTEYYEKTHRRNVNNKIAALLTGDFSVGTVANTWIISEQTALNIQATIGAKFNNKRLRDKFMQETACMTLIVYNQDYQRITIYNHGLDDISEISMSYLEKKQKSDNFDFDVFKMLAQGSAPII